MCEALPPQIRAIFNAKYVKLFFQEKTSTYTLFIKWCLTTHNLCLPSCRKAPENSSAAMGLSIWIGINIKKGSNKCFPVNALKGAVTCCSETVET